MLCSRESGGRRRGGKRASEARSSIDVVFRDRSLSRLSLTWWLDIGKVQRPALELLVADSSLWTRETREKRGKGCVRTCVAIFFSLSLRAHRRRRVRESHLADRAGLPWGGLLGGGLLLAAPQDHGGGILLGDHLVHRAPVRLGRRSAFASVPPTAPNRATYVARSRDAPRGG